MEPASPAIPSTRRPRRQLLVLLGLLTTFLGLGALALGLPATLPLNGSVFAYVALGVLLLFVSGSLLGYAAGARGRGRP